ncbi:MAG TPA: DUF5752 family protein [Gammaproteobacteria bacterium]|nr:DUF5752 family protein [Gammaproteobacteria bacterium]
MVKKTLAADDPPEEFAVKDCALVAIATGRKALTAKELRDHLLAVEVGSVYHHFWGGLLHAHFEEREFNNDFAAWVKHGLHDSILAERLAMLDPTDYPDLEELRQEIVDLIDARLDESESLHWTRASQQFELARSQIVIFDTGNRLSQAGELVDLIPKLSASSIFYHLIDARRRLPEHGNDFSLWLLRFGEEYTDLRAELDGIDPYFGSLSELREQLTVMVHRHLAESAP